MGVRYHELSDEGAVLVAKYEHWSAPKGHAPWCRMNICPAVSATPRKCSCTRNSTAKHLRRLEALKREGKA